MLEHDVFASVTTLTVSEENRLCPLDDGNDFFFTAASVINSCINDEKNNNSLNFNFFPADFLTIKFVAGTTTASGCLHTVLQFVSITAVMSFDFYDISLRALDLNESCFSLSTVMCASYLQGFVIKRSQFVLYPVSGTSL